MRAGPRADRFPRRGPSPGLCDRGLPLPRSGHAVELGTRAARRATRAVQARAGHPPHGSARRGGRMTHAAVRDWLVRNTPLEAALLEGAGFGATVGERIASAAAGSESA